MTGQNFLALTAIGLLAAVVGAYVVVLSSGELAWRLLRRLVGPE